MNRNKLEICRQVSLWKESGMHLHFYTFHPPILYFQVTKIPNLPLKVSGNLSENLLPLQPYSSFLKICLFVLCVHFVFKVVIKTATVLWSWYLYIFVVSWRVSFGVWHVIHYSFVMQLSYKLCLNVFLVKAPTIWLRQMLTRYVVQLKYAELCYKLIRNGYS